MLALVIYPLLGVWLSRMIGARVKWSDCHATVANVSGAKLALILRWPLDVPVFVAQLLVAKYL